MKKLICWNSSYLLAICWVITCCFTSCETREIEPTQSASMEYPSPTMTGEITDFNYVYQGEVYEEQTFIEQFEGQDFQRMIALGELVYVFDTKEEGVIFETGPFQKIWEEYDPAQKNDLIAATARSVGSIVYGYGAFRFHFYDLANYSGATYSLYRRMRIGRKKTWIGYEWVDNEKSENLPSVFRQKAQSYKMEYVEIPTIEGWRMQLEVDFGVLTLEDDMGRVWNRTLLYQPEMGIDNTFDSDGNLDNNHYWGLSWLPTWNNKIQSWKVKFDSYHNVN